MDKENEEIVTDNCKLNEGMKGSQNLTSEGRAIHKGQAERLLCRRRELPDEGYTVGDLAIISYVVITT